jgi:hypothetical protein
MKNVDRKHENRERSEIYACITRLLDQGFTTEEAAHLVFLRETRLPETSDALPAPGMLFARWLVDHGRLNEDG